MKQAIRITAAFLLGLLFLPLTLTAQADDGYTTPGKGKGTPFDRHVPFDYHNYIGQGIVEKVFDYYDSDTRPCDPTMEKHQFQRTEVEGGTQVDKLRIQYNASATCQTRGFRYLDLADKRVLVARQYSPTSGAEFKDPLTRLTSTMRIGDSWATASGVNATGFPATHVIEKGTLVGVEDVSVPAGDFKGCLRIQIERWSLAVGSFNRIAWYCPGVGLTKHITMNFTDPAAARTVRIKLLSYTPAS